MARDGHQFDAWLVAPTGPARGALVVVQEIFGVNAHIRAVADGFAAAGFLTIAPSLFDRVCRHVELAYDAQHIEEGRGYALQIPDEKALLDINTCVNVVKHAGPVAVVGYCWGGTLAYLAACDLPIRAAVSYYGTRTVQQLDKTPHAPLQYHFGDRDKSIPPDAIEKIRAANPQGEFHVYAADHGFNCDHRATYDAAAAQLARKRTLAFLDQRFGGD